MAAGGRWWETGQEISRWGGRTEGAVCHTGHVKLRATSSLGESHAVPQAVTAANVAGRQQLQRRFRRFQYMCNMGTGPTWRSPRQETQEGKGCTKDQMQH